MKKLLCVLMFGMVFGQDAITTREFEIPFNFEMNTLDLSEHIDFVDGLYEVYQIKTEFDNIDCSWLASCDMGMAGLGFYGALDGSLSINLNSSDCEDLSPKYRAHYEKLLISSNNSILSMSFCCDCNPNPNLSGTMTIRVSGRFDDTDVGLNGDMNEDGELDVLDVVSLVQEILGGGMGDVGDLLNIVTG